MAIDLEDGEFSAEGAEYALEKSEVVASGPSYLFQVQDKTLLAKMHV